MSDQTKPTPPDGDELRTQPVPVVKPPTPPVAADDGTITAPVPTLSDAETGWEILSKPLYAPPTPRKPADDDMRTAPIDRMDSDVLSKPLIIPPRKPADDDMRTAPIDRMDSNVLSKPLIIPPRRPSGGEVNDDMRTAPMSEIDSEIYSKPLIVPPRSSGDQANDNLRTMPMSTAQNVASPTHIGTPTAAPNLVPDAARRGWMQTVRRQLNTDFNPSTEWIGVVYSPDIDNLLAHTALEDEDADVAEQAARTIGRIRSQAAVAEIARRQRTGAKGALRALAVVRDEAASLPNSVAWWARLFAWLANVWRRLAQDPTRMTWRFLFAAIGAGLAFGFYTWLNLPGFSIFTPERWSKGISFGLTMGILYGFRAILAGEAPSRMRGFFSWWGIIAWSLIVGVSIGALTWGAFTWLILEYPVTDWGLMAFAGLGGAVGLGITALVRLPGVIAALIDAISLWIPLFIGWSSYWNDTTGSAQAFIYFRTFEGVYSELIPMVAAIAIGAHLPAILNGARALIMTARRRVGALRQATT